MKKLITTAAAIFAAGIILTTTSISSKAEETIDPADYKVGSGIIAEVNNACWNTPVAVVLEEGVKQTVASSKPSMIEDIAETVEEDRRRKEEERIRQEAINTKIAKMVMAEAGGESTLGKRLVIDVILNRMDSPRFPSSVDAIFYQQGQWESLDNGRYDAAVPTEEVLQLVREERECRTNNSVLYFRTEGYHQFGTPLIREGHHFFSK